MADDPANEPAANEPAANEPPASGNEPPAPASRPEGIPDELWGDTGFNADAFGKYRPPAADLPSAADAYQLPAIDGVEIDGADPLIGVLRTRAFENGIGQEGFGAIVTDYVTALKEADTAAHTAEMDALGSNGEQRITALSTYLDANLPKDEAEAVKALATSAKAVQGLERLMNKGATNAPRDNPPPPPARKTRDDIRKLMDSPAYRGREGERDPAVIKEVEDWWKEQDRLDTEARAKP